MRMMALILVGVLIIGLVASCLGSVLIGGGTPYGDVVRANADHFMSAGLPEAKALSMARVIDDEGIDAEITGIDTEDTGDFYLLNLYFGGIDYVCHMYVDYDGTMFQFGSGEVGLDDLQDHMLDSTIQDYMDSLWEADGAAEGDDGE